MLYQEPTALSNNSLNGRQTTLSRLIKDCQVEHALFSSSHCTPTDGKSGGMQSWQIRCFLPYNISHPETHEFTTRTYVSAFRDGHCHFDENCVDGRGLNAFGHIDDVATCVSQEDYVVIDPWNSNVKTRLKPPLGRKRTNVVLSEMDKNTPLEVDTFDVQTTTAEDPVLDRKCRDCMELRTDVLEPSTERVRTEVTLLTTGIAAGVLWLTVISG